MKNDSFNHPGGARALLALALALVAALVAVSVAEGADANVGEYFTVDGIEYVVTDEGSHQVEIIGYEGSPEHVYGTVSYYGYEWTVVSVGDGAFDGCGSLTTVDLPSATFVGLGAFNYCGSLTTVDLPSATYVGEGAFYSCESLTTVDLSSATYVGESALLGCDALTFARFSDELESVGVGAFSVSFYSGSELLSADAASLKGRTFMGSGNGVLYEGFAVASPDGGGTVLCRVTDGASHKVEIYGYEGSPEHVHGTVSYGGADWTVVSVGDRAFHGC
ncbi:MAG: leucine-rich repeat domain-containing protein, partial [Candidatus Methanomethylophilaceae archaeon]|nr:leucine-rich repeat domain-containing protein [Candidatus Methanomethylophilaceae archaeon]